MVQERKFENSVISESRRIDYETKVNSKFIDKNKRKESLLVNESIIISKADKKAKKLAKKEMQALERLKETYTLH